MKKIALFASGSGSNVQNIADFFSKHESIQIDCVLCNNPNAYVLQRSKNMGVDTYIFDRDDFYESQNVLDYLLNRNVDFIVLAGFLWLIPSYLIEAYPNKIINIHPALLPKFGGKGMYGMRVHKSVVEAKEKESGITIHYVNENYDEGNIIFQARCDVLEQDKPEDVANKVHQLEYEYFPKIILKVIEEEVQ